MSGISRSPALCVAQVRTRWRLYNSCRRLCRTRVTSASRAGMSSATLAAYRSPRFSSMSARIAPPRSSRCHALTTTTSRSTWPKANLPRARRERIAGQQSGERSLRVTVTDFAAGLLACGANHNPSSQLLHVTVPNRPAVALCCVARCPAPPASLSLPCWPRQHRVRTRRVPGRPRRASEQGLISSRSTSRCSQRTATRSGD